MNIKDNAVLRVRLAAEYALDTSRGPARHGFETWLRADAAWRAAVSSWQGAGRDGPTGRAGSKSPSSIERRLQLAPWWQF